MQVRVLERVSVCVWHGTAGSRTVPAMSVAQERGAGCVFLQKKKRAGCGAGSFSRTPRRDSSHNVACLRFPSHVRLEFSFSLVTVAGSVFRCFLRKFFKKNFTISNH